MKAQILKAYSVFVEDGRAVARCAICGEIISPPWDVHEWAFDRNCGDWVFHTWNQVPLHHSCHLERGKHSDARVACAWMAMLAAMPSNIPGGPAVIASSIKNALRKLRRPAPGFPYPGYAMGYTEETRSWWLLGAYFLPTTKSCFEDAFPDLKLQSTQEYRRTIAGAYAKFVIEFAAGKPMPVSDITPPPWWPIKPKTGGDK